MALAARPWDSSLTIVPKMAALLIPAVLTALGLAPRSRLAFVGGSLMIAGYVCYFGVLLSNMLIIAMAERGGPFGDYAAVIDTSQRDLATAWVFPIFIVGNLLGTLLFAIGADASRRAMCRRLDLWASVARSGRSSCEVLEVIVRAAAMDCRGGSCGGCAGRTGAPTLSGMENAYSVD